MLEVEEYVEQRIKELVAFREDWKRRRAESPGVYPRTMAEGRWYVQELAFNSAENGRIS